MDSSSSTSSSSSSTLLTSFNRRKSSPTMKPPRQKRKTTTVTTNNKPIKVRYISNPMRIETCASKFRELVQELTGQDAVDHLSHETTNALTDHVDLHRPFVSENLAPLDEDQIREYYSPLDEEVFAPHMSTSLSWFYNNNALGTIGSL